MVDGNLMVPFG